MKNLNIFEFLNALTVFIREFHNVINEIQVFNYNFDKQVKNAVEAELCFITIHNFLYIESEMRRIRMISTVLSKIKLSMY